MVNGNRVEVSVILPCFAEVEQNVAHGRDTNNIEITELINDLQM
jgi:hypothetical protein